MFTAARLIAALCMAGMAYVASEYIKLLFDEIQRFGNFNYINAAVGFLCGWIIVGPRAGRGMAAAISHCITATVMLVFWCLLVYSLVDMWELAMRHRYSGPMDAVNGVFEIALEYGAYLLDTGLAFLLAIGALVTAVFSEIASRHWR
ncbi:TrgA family protein [Salipiger bermudensis]|nr:TrgA family protein [Salipiger bermudensis]